MLNNHKIVVCTPAGRKEYLEILVPYILRDRHFVDEYQLWANTDNKEDLDYIKYIGDSYPNFIKIIYRNPNIPVNAINLCIFQFFANCIEKDTVYIRIDDDILFIANDALRKLAEFRINNPNYFLVYGNIINNSICSHLHQRFGAIDTKLGHVGYSCTDSLGWGNPKFAEYSHQSFFEKFKLGEIDQFKFNKWELYYYERCSINVISWLGQEFKKFNGVVGHDEELWLSVQKPSEIVKINCIYGHSIFSHYAFCSQREYLKTTDILKLYKNLSYHLPYYQI